MSVEARKNFSDVGRELENQTQKLLVLLEQPFQEAVDPASVNKEYVLNVPHLMLNKAVQKAAENVFNRTVESQNSWEGGATSCGDYVFESHMQPTLKKVIKTLKDNECQKALGFIMGISLFLHRDDMGWMSDNECYMEKAWSKWFKDFSLCWRIILTNTDTMLGLDCVGGLEGGYRAPLIKMLEGIQSNGNALLIQQDDCFQDTAMHSRISIFPMPKVKETAADLPGRKRSAGKENTQPTKKRKTAAVEKKKTGGTGNQYIWLPKGMSAAERRAFIQNMPSSTSKPSQMRTKAVQTPKEPSKKRGIPKDIAEIKPRKKSKPLKPKVEVEMKVEPPKAVISTRSGRKSMTVQRY